MHEYPHSLWYTELTMTETSTPEIVQSVEQGILEARAVEGRDTLAPYERGEVAGQVTNEVDRIKSTLGISSGSAQAEGEADIATQDPQLVAQVQALVNVAFSQDVGAAITQATATGNPALIDALHDALIDHVHEELLNRQKIQPAP